MATDWSSQRNPYEPLGYFRGVALDATLMLVAIHILTMVAAVPLFATNKENWLVPLIFTSSSLPFENPWSLLTYPFVHNIAQEGLWFAIGLYFFFQFGREVERFIGRHSYILLYALLAVAPALLCWALKPVLGSFAMAGASSLHFSIFAAFTFIYPGVLFFFNIQARTLFWIFFAVYSLLHLAGRNWAELVQFWSCIGLAYVFLKYLGVGSETRPFSWFASWRARREEKRHLQRMQRHARTVERKTQNIDLILEKISRSGMQSLTEEERRDLEKASRRLQERDSSVR